MISGISMAFAEISRPASGLEHYFSHLWEMQALLRSKPSDLHGIQVGVGTLLVLWIYENMLKTNQVDTAQAEKAMREFSPDSWESTVRSIFGPVTDTVLDIEKKVGKNLPETQKRHLQIIEEHWDEIQSIIREELPSREEIYGLMARCHMPLRPSDLGISVQDTVAALKGSREIRDKYLTSSLLWDLGLLGQTADRMAQTPDIL